MITVSNHANANIATANDGGAIVAAIVGTVFIFSLTASEEVGPFSRQDETLDETNITNMAGFS